MKLKSIRNASAKRKLVIQSQAISRDERRQAQIARNFRVKVAA